MRTKEIIQKAKLHLEDLPGEVFDTIDLGKPDSREGAQNLIKIILKT